MKTIIVRIEVPEGIDLTSEDMIHYFDESTSPEEVNLIFENLQLCSITASTME